VFNEMIERMEKGEATGIVSWHPLCKYQWLCITAFVFWSIGNSLFKDQKSFS
jgi:hypothetical protein